MPTFFVSYVFEDRAYAAQVGDWSNRGQLSPWSAVYEQEDHRQEGAMSVRAYLSPLIKSAQAVVLLVGKDSHNRPWIDYEIQNSRSAGKPILVVRLPNTIGGPPRTVTGAEITFDPGSLQAALLSIH